MNQEEESGVPALATLGILAGVGLIYGYVSARRVTRKRLKQIEDWKVERQACIENVKARLQYLAEDENCTAEEFWEEYNTEFAFLDQIIGPRPE